MKYIYYVSYSHAGTDKMNFGFGMLEASFDTPITSFEHIKEMCQLIEQRDNLKNIIVIFYQLLRVENV